jgi:regulator of replication initiation timing
MPNDEDDIKQLYNEGMFDWMFGGRKKKTAFLSNYSDQLMKLYRELDRLKEDYPQKVRRIRSNIRTAMTDLQDLKISIEHGVVEKEHFISDKE